MAISGGLSAEYAPGGGFCHPTVGAIVDSMLRYDDTRRTLELGVHDLLEAAPARGDLSLPLLWSSASRMRAGQRAHVAWQRARAGEESSYAAEVAVRHTLQVSGWEVIISGRIDGLFDEGEHAVVEEVKSTALPEAELERRGPEDFPDWTFQLQLYLFLLEAKGRLAVGRLVLTSLLDGAWRVMQVSPDPGVGEIVRGWLAAILANREARNAWYARRRETTIPFAHDHPRPGQEALVAATKSALFGRQHLLLAAPTGLGKTAAALSAALTVAYATDRRVFFATARGTQQRLAEATVAAMVARGLPVRAVSLRAREKVCLNEVVVCRADACRFASAYHDKVRERDLVARALEATPVLPEALMRLGEAAVVCPFALSMDIAATADLVIGDYNYIFDPSVRPARLFEEGLDGWIVIADEVHNLPERAMGYASPALSLVMAEAAYEARRDDPEAAPFAELADEVATWLREGWERIGGEDPEAWGGEAVAAWGDGEVALPIDADLKRRARELAERVEALAVPYALFRLREAAVGPQVSLFGARAEAGPGPAGDDPWQALGRAVLRLRGALDRAGEETVAVWRAASRTDAGLQLLCRDPSPVLGPLYAVLYGSVGMSATLEPARFYQDLLGLEPARVAHYRVGSPFPPENRLVLVVPGVTTAFRHRARDAAATAALISEAVRAVPGNVAVFFSSFALRDDLLPSLDLGARPLLVQPRNADEATRTQLLDTLSEGRDHVLLGVLGGVFSEGVDLPGRALLAAIIVGPALPAVCLERKLLEAWYQERYGQGSPYAYWVPGMAKVVQAAGRVIRTPEDRGAIVLIDRRFLLNEVRAYFPEEWDPVRAAKPGALLAEFWAADQPAPAPDRDPL